MDEVVEYVEPVESREDSLDSSQSIDFSVEPIDFSVEPIGSSTVEPIGSCKKIKHIVMSGGGVTGLSFYGILRDKQKEGLWNIEDIQSMYGTSAGSMIAVFLALNYDWDTIDDYIIKRPWQNVYKFNMQTILFTFQTKGIFDNKVVEETFLPLFKGKDISIDITMKEFYEVNSIDLHIYTVDINSFELIDISHKTHPDWRVVDAVYCSCSLPIIFQPTIENGKCFIDGGFFVNYPIQYCIESGADPDEILGICRIPINKSNKNIEEKSSLFDYILNIFYKTVHRISTTDKKYNIKHEILVESPAISLYDLFTTTNSMEERLRLVSRRTGDQ